VCNSVRMGGVYVLSLKQQRRKGREWTCPRVMGVLVGMAVMSTWRRDRTPGLRTRWKLAVD
jgi:hypothetical protein